MARATVRRYDTDPSTPARGIVLPRSIFDNRPHRNRGMNWIGAELPYPTDTLLIATLVAHGQPRWVAEEVRRHGGVRYGAYKFWSDVRDAAQGDKGAQERVDRIREMFEQMRRDGRISDTPNHAEPFG